MQLRIRCSQCDKAILVDRAFAGGVCRCPYCKAIVPVPAIRPDESPPRPDAPPSRPDAPPRRDDAPPVKPRPEVPRPDAPVPKPRRGDGRSPVTAVPAEGPPSPSPTEQPATPEGPPSSTASDASRDASPTGARDASPTGARDASRNDTRAGSRTGRGAEPRTSARSTLRASDSPAGPPGSAQATSATPSRPNRRKRRSRRVMRQAMGLVLLGAMVAGIVIAVAVMAMRQGEQGPGSGGKPPTGPGAGGALGGSRIDPFATTTSGPGVAGDVPISPPVVYVVDAGAGMLETLDPALEIVATSVASMTPDQRFAVVLLKETARGQVRVLPAGADGLAPAGRSAAAALRRETRSLYAGGSIARIEPKALRKALELKPATLVLLVKQDLDTSRLAGLLEGLDVRLVTLALGSYQQVRRRMDEVTRKLGGTFRAYDQATLDRLAP